MRPAGGSLGALQGRTGVIDGQIEEDGANVYTSVAVCGDAVRLERRVGFNAAGTGTGLEKAWSDLDEDAFRDFIANHPDDPNSEAAFRQACWKFPRVFAAYQIPSDFDWLAGTKYESGGRVGAPPPMLPHLLSGFVEEAANGEKGRRFPHPISIELENDDEEYRVQTMLDGLDVDEDGTIWLAALREAGLTNPEGGTWLGEISDTETLEARGVRMTVAFEIAQRVTAAAGIGGASGEASDPERTAGAWPVICAAVLGADTAGAYREHLRKNSWPLPQSVNGASAAEDRAGAGSELVSDAER